MKINEGTTSLMTIIPQDGQQLDPRAAIIAGLRKLADVLETIPEVPAPPRGFLSWALDGDDSTAVPQYEAAVAALTDAGIAFEHRVNDHDHKITLPIAGVTVWMHHVHDRIMDEYDARTSYNDVVQVDEQAAPVTS